MFLCGSAIAHCWIMVLPKLFGMMEPRQPSTPRPQVEG